MAIKAAVKLESDLHPSLLLSQVDGVNLWLKHGRLGHHCVCQMAISKVYVSV